MSDFLRRLFAPAEPVLSPAGVADAGRMARLHAESFRRGWSEDEIEQLLLDRTVVGHRALRGRSLVGFVLSRFAAGEAEILSIAVARTQQGRGTARRLLDLHMRRLAGLGAGAIFLEVDEDNAPACRLYARAGFREVGRRPGYYLHGARPANALVLRRDLV